MEICHNQACDRELDPGKNFCRPCSAAFQMGLTRAQMQGVQRTEEARDLGTPMVEHEMLSDSLMMVQSVIAGLLMRGGLDVDEAERLLQVPIQGHRKVNVWHQLVQQVLARLAGEDGLSAECAGSAHDECIHSSATCACDHHEWR